MAVKWLSHSIRNCDLMHLPAAATAINHTVYYCKGEMKTAKNQSEKNVYSEVLEKPKQP